MIYDFTWSSVTATTDRLAPEEAMLLGNTLKRTIRHVLKADPTLGPIYLSKVYLADVYMRLWVRMEDIPSLVFLIPEKHPSNPHLIGFHLSLPMGYIYGASFFCATTETATDTTNTTIVQRQVSPPHLPETASSTWEGDDTGSPTPTEYTTGEALSQNSKPRP